MGGGRGRRRGVDGRGGEGGVIGRKGKWDEGEWTNVEGEGGGVHRGGGRRRWSEWRTVIALPLPCLCPSLDPGPLLVRSLTEHTYAGGEWT